MKSFYGKYAVELDVYEKKDRRGALLVLFGLFLLGIIFAFIVGRDPVIDYYAGVKLSKFRITGSIVLSIIYFISYFLLTTDKTTKKLYQVSAVIGIITGSISFIFVLLMLDVSVLMKAANIYSVQNFFGKFSYYANYFTNCTWQFLPVFISLGFSCWLRPGLKSKTGEEEVNSGLYGTAKWADQQYLKECEMLNEKISAPKSLFGKSLDGKKYLAENLCNRTIISKPGGGKTTGVTIPALLTENRPCVVHDPKGELWAVTSKYRIEKFKRKIITIDPFNVTEKEGFRLNKKQYADKLKKACINPLDYIPEEEDKKDRFITSLVSSIVKAAHTKTGEASEHFYETTKSLIGGLIDFVYMSKGNKELCLKLKEKNETCSKEALFEYNTNKEKIDAILKSNSEGILAQKLKDDLKRLELEFEAKKNKTEKYKISRNLQAVIENKENKKPNLFDVYSILNTELDDIVRDMKFIMEFGSVRSNDAAATVLTTGSNERGSILSTVRRQLAWLVDFNLRSTFTRSNVDLKMFLKGEHDIYIIMPEDQVNQQSRVIRMIISLITSSLIQAEAEELSSREYLFILDELGQLDYNPDLENAIEILRAKKCIFWSVFQSYSQIQKYDKADLFIDTGMLQFFSVGDPKIMDMIQKLGGTQTKFIERSNHSASKNRKFGSIINGSISSSDGSSSYEVKTDLIHFNEIRELPKNEQYVFIDGHRPIHCRKLRYFEDLKFLEYDLNPLEEKISKPASTNNKFSSLQKNTNRKKVPAL